MSNRGGDRRVQEETVDYGCTTAVVVASALQDARPQDFSLGDLAIREGKTGGRVGSDRGEKVSRKGGAPFPAKVVAPV